MTNRNCDTCKYKGTSLLTFPCTGCFSYLHRPYHKPYWIEKEPEVTKPPLGVMPYKLWLEDRVVKLCEALIRSANHGTINDWSVERVEELKMHVHKLREVNR